MIQLLFALLLSGYLALAEGYVVKTFPLKNQQATLTIDDKGAHVTIGSKRMLLSKDLTADELEAVAGFIGPGEQVTIADYNFDGYSDIGIVVSVGYGGVNVFRDYYTYNPATKSFELFLEEASNLKINNGTLVSSARSGMYWMETHYRIVNGKPQKTLKKTMLTGITDLVEEFDLKGNKIRTYYDPAHLTVTVPKSYFHDRPDVDSRTSSYIIKGDRVKILEIDGSLQWVKIAYASQSKHFIAWIELNTVTEAE